MNMKYLLLSAAAVAAGLTLAPAQAATVTANMHVEITIQNACAITVAPTDLNFGSHGVLAANIDNLSTMSVTCTTNAAYDIGLNAGLNGAGDINARKMILSGNTVGYQLYTDAIRSNVWGNTVGTDTVHALGTGNVVVYTIYGRVPPQATPPAGTYVDTVTVTVTY